MGEAGKPPGAPHELFELGARRWQGAAAAGNQKEALLIPQLQELEGDFRELRREAAAVADGLSHGQFNWRPGSGQWSIAECLGHLNMIGSDPLASVDAGIREARSRQWYSQGPFRIGYFAGQLIRAAQPPVRWKQSANHKFVPPSDQPIGLVVPAIIDLQTQLIGRLALANGLNLARIRVAAPGRLILRLNLYELFMYLAAHGRRHLEQAWRVRRDRMLPKTGPARPGGTPQRA
jgi:hypothetical protein